ncbi:MAG TPA: TetR/AcrR family transcriptional regulator, partial [Pseudonocardia sp.]|nr:TetR/AcrR family transcriptional regulator [Pseudonocardia sp.]
MPRPAGSRNRDYAATRRALVDAVAPHLLDETGEPNTVKALAAAAGVSVPTLKHYFGDRDGVVRAVLEAVHTDSRVYLDRMAALAHDPPEQVLPAVLVGITETWRRYGLGRMFASTLALGLEHDSLGPAFVDDVLEPLLQAMERLLTGFVEAGTLPPTDVRAAALSIVGPVVLGLLHQDNLRGTRCRPLDVEHFARTHSRTVLDGL